MEKELLKNDISKNAYSFHGNLAQDAQVQKDYHERKGVVVVKRYLIPFIAFLLGSALMAEVYFGILTWAQGWDYAASQFLRNRWYILPIFITLGIQAALYSILRFRLFVPTTTTRHTGAMIGASGSTSATAMVACCLHHVTDVLPILGLSAAATFLTRYQHPFMLLGLGLNLIGIILMLVILYRESQKLQSIQRLQSVLLEAK
jgi:hypothetical protein